MCGDQTKSTSEGFVKQRRNLFLSSVALLFAQTADLTFTGDLKTELGGLGARFNNPDVIIFWLWAALLYFLIRYYQYDVMTGDKGIGQAFAGAEQGYMRPVFIEKLKQKLRDISIPPNDIPDPIITIEIELPYRMKPLKYTWATDRLDVTYKSPDGRSTVIQEVAGKQQLEITGLDLYFIQLKAAWYVTAKTHLDTEYRLPYLMALLPFLYELMRHH